MANSDIDPLTATMSKIKAWLKTESIPIGADDSDVNLRLKVKRRFIRKANNREDRPIRGVTSALSLG